MSYKVQADGSLTFPSRGSTRPDLVPGYIYDPNDMFRQTPVLPDCELRQTEIQTLTCGKKIPFFVCIAGHECGYNQCLTCIKTGKRDRSL